MLHGSSSLDVVLPFYIETSHAGRYTGISMKIETLLTEAEISEEFAEAMEARDVPEKFFYWQPLCVRAWLALSQGMAYESRLHSWNLLVDDAEAISSHLDSIAAVIS